MNYNIERIVQENILNPKFIDLLDKALTELIQLDKLSGSCAKGLGQKFGIIENRFSYNLTDKQIVEIDLIDLALQKLEESNLVEGINDKPQYKTFTILPEGKLFAEKTSFKTIAAKFTYSQLAKESDRAGQSALVASQLADLPKANRHRTNQILFWIISVIVNGLFLIYNLLYKCN